MFNHEFILEILCLSQETPSFRNSALEKLLSLRHGKSFFKDASFLETNKIIGLNMLYADGSPTRELFRATEKSLFEGGAHYPSRSRAAHLHMKEEVHKSPFLFSNTSSNQGPLSSYRKTQMAYGSFWRRG